MRLLGRKKSVGEEFVFALERGRFCLSLAEGVCGGSGHGGGKGDQGGNRGGEEGVSQGLVGS